MTNSVPEHEKLFDEICNKLNELSTHNQEEGAIPPQPKYEQMQVQMKKFHTELNSSQEELMQKIRSLENVSFGPETLDAQSRQIVDQLSAERASNAKLSSDLARSLELSLQLQLEIQGLKARALQMQSEEKKYSQALFERNKLIQRDLDLNQALKDETAVELVKAKSAFAKEVALWDDQHERFEQEIQSLKQERLALQETEAGLRATLEERDQTIASLNEEIEKISTSFNEVENSAHRQNEVLKNLMTVAEGKIVEMKLALDKKAMEAQDYYSHLQQALTQFGIMKQENVSLKEYVSKLNYYHQQAQQAQMAVAQMAQVAATQVQQTSGAPMTAHNAQLQAQTTATT